MNRGSSARQCGHKACSGGESGIASSPSQARHLKCITAAMKFLAVMLLIAVSAHAQSLADAARKERERQAKLRPTRVITSTASAKVEEPKPPAAAAEQPKPAENKGVVPEPSKAVPKPQTPPTVDPVQVWSNQLDQLRTKIRALQDQEMALVLQQNQVTNQVYAPVTDPATQERALAQLGQVQQQLAAVRKDLDEAKKMLDSMQLQGPPKK